MLKPTAGEVLGAGAGVVLLGAMTLDWFAVDITAERIRGADALADQAGNRNAWEAFEGIDLVLLIAALVAITPIAAELTGGLPDLPIHPGAVVALAGMAGVVAAIVGITDPPVEAGQFAGGIVVEVAREPGAWLGLGACLGIVAGGLLSARRDPY